MRRSSAALVAGVALLAVSVGRATPADAAQSINRPDDPVVLTGAKLGGHVLGVAPQRLVAYRFDGAWSQVPVQVDERVVVDWATVRHLADPDMQQTTALLYVDQLTGTGIPDDDKRIDANDEVVFMARDAGSASSTTPGGVVAGSGVRVKVTDPLDGQVGYVYLFTSTAKRPTQPTTGVRYSFDLAHTPYVLTYGFGGTTAGPNPEDSTITTPTYRTHFADRWLRDRLRIGTSADLIDREKVLFTPGICGRTVTTADYAGGAFIANKVGPVRAIRSYVAFNSGLITQRDHFFYDHREDETTYLRVHAIPGAMTFLDFSSVARGMTYTAQRYGGLPALSDVVDGSTSAPLDLPPLRWDMISGSAQGTIVRSSRVDVAKVIPVGEAPLPGEGVVVRSYYEDNDTTPTDRCTNEVDDNGNPLPPDDADGDALASSGVWAQPQPPGEDGEDLLPCTDPLRDPGTPPGAGVCDRRWNLSVRTYYDFVAPGTSVSDAQAQARSDDAVNPVTTKVRQLA